MDILAPVALLAAIAAALGAGFLLWSGQGANRAGRGALFNTERQVAYDRAKRSRYSALALGAVSIVLFVFYFVTSGSAGIALEPTPTPTRTPRPTATMAPARRETLIATLRPPRRKHRHWRRASSRMRVSQGCGCAKRPAALRSIF